MSFKRLSYKFNEPKNYYYSDWIIREMKIMRDIFWRQGIKYRQENLSFHSSICTAHVGIQEWDLSRSLYSWRIIISAYNMLFLIQRDYIRSMKWVKACDVCFFIVWLLRESKDTRCEIRTCLAFFAYAMRCLFFLSIIIPCAKISRLYNSVQSYE